MDSDNTQEFLQRLNNAGVEDGRLITHEQDSLGATETKRRRNCRIVEATVNEGLKQILLGTTRVFPDCTAEERVGWHDPVHKGDSIYAASLQLHSTPNRLTLRSLADLLEAVGAREVEILALLEFMLARTTVGQGENTHPIASIHCRQGNKLLTVKEACGTKQQTRAPGEIYVRTIRPAVPTELEDQWARMTGIAGEAEFFQRQADMVSSGNRKGLRSNASIAIMQSRSSAVSMSLSGNSADDCGDSHTMAMVGNAPGWMMRNKVKAHWTPEKWRAEVERNSAMCIRFEQKYVKENAPAVERNATRHAIKQALNNIQRACWTEAINFEVEHVDFLGYWRRNGKFTGMITVACPDGGDIERVTLAATLLAFFIGNDSVQPDSRAEHKWCPMQQTLGESVCKVNSITRQQKWGGKRTNLWIGSTVSPKTQWSQAS